MQLWYLSWDVLNGLIHHLLEDLLFFHLIQQSWVVYLQLFDFGQMITSWYKRRNSDLRRGLTLFSYLTCVTLLDNSLIVLLDDRWFPRQRGFTYWKAGIHRFFTLLLFIILYKVNQFFTCPDSIITKLTTECVNRCYHTLLLEQQRLKLFDNLVFAFVVHFELIGLFYVSAELFHISLPNQGFLLLDFIDVELL